MATKKQNKTEVQNNATVKTDAMTRIMQIASELADANKNVQMYPVTGYTTLKYGNKVLCELHAKKRGFSHITFSTTQAKVFDILQAKQLIHRVVPKSYGWKFNTEVIASDELVKIFPKLLKLALENAQPKQKTEKTAKQA